MNPSHRCLALLCLLSAAACSTANPGALFAGADSSMHSASAFIDARSGSPSAMERIAHECAGDDVIFFGEIHDSDECHEQQRVLFAALCKGDRDLVVSMEMFERDVQGEVDSYLAGKIEEAAFRKDARAWKNWHHYKPILELARKYGVPVIAANAPKELVRKVSKKGGGGLAEVAGNAHVARVMKAPKDAYFRAFVDAMSGHLGNSGGDAVERFYMAQVVRDETMAESIATHLEKAHAAGQRPLVLHLCGDFHSSSRRGTVSRLLRRLPDLKIKVITTTTEGIPSKTEGDYRIALSKRKVISKPKAKPKAKPDAKAKAKAKPEPEEEEEEIDPGARPGLGFMPAYESDEEGCLVNMVMPGSAAANAGIKKDDLIIELDGEPIEDVRAYSEVLGGLKIGSKVKLVVKRGGKKVKLTAKVGVSQR